VKLDLHIHTALSACAENIMSPRRILAAAGAAGVKLLALTDHNASGHVELALRLAPEYGVRVVPAMEVSSLEDVHLLAYFRDPAALADFQYLIDGALPPDPHPSDILGYQVRYDADDEIVGLDERWRSGGVDLPLGRLVDEIHARAGFAVPAHVYRPRFSLVSQLGFIDPEAGYDALEIQRAHWQRDGWTPDRRLEGYPVITGSDAHYLDDIGRYAVDIPLPFAIV
jgi:3',5'-nucleoside bisphosphate phosphatase